MATLMQRALGAARLDPGTYEDVEHDPSALSQAMTVVVVASVAAGIGSAGYAADIGLGSLLLGTVLNLVGWFVWAAITYFVGTRLLPTAETEADIGQLLRTTGFSAAPGVLGILGILPAVGGLVLFVASVWQLAAMVIAVRQALDYSSTPRAVGVCLIGFAAYLAIAVVLVGALLATGVVATGGEAPL